MTPVTLMGSVGGLRDSVFDADYSDKPYHERNGYVFNDFNYEGLESAMHRAIGLWYSYPDYFRELTANGMKYDFSWNHPGQNYLNVYEYMWKRK